VTEVRVGIAQPRKEDRSRDHAEPIILNTALGHDALAYSGAGDGDFRAADWLVLNMDRFSSGITNTASENFVCDNLFCHNPGMELLPSVNNVKSPAVAAWSDKDVIIVIMIAHAKSELS